jgi:Zn-dependent M28 family amino/carboxypeptidase
MEVARRLMELPRRPARNVICMTFSGEEEGLLGSRAWVDDPPIPMNHVVAMVNADMVGRLRKNHLIVLGTSSSPLWRPLFDRADDGLGLDMGADSGEDLSDRSDQASFHAEDVPIAFLFTGMHPDYHRPSDTADKINAPGLETIATLSARVIVGIAEDGFGARRAD